MSIVMVTRGVCLVTGSAIQCAGCIVVEIDDTPIHWHVTQGALQVVMVGWLSVKMAAKAVCHFRIGVIYKGW